MVLPSLLHRVRLIVKLANDLVILDHQDPAAMLLQQIGPIGKKECVVVFQ